MKNFFLIKSLNNSSVKKSALKFHEHIPIVSFYFLKGTSNRTKNKDKFLFRKDKIIHSVPFIV